MTALAWLNAACTLLVGVVAILHLNETHRRPWVERIGFALVAGGGLGNCLEYVWPWPQGAFWADTIMNLGLAIVAFGLSRGQFRAMLDRALEIGPMNWNGQERRRDSREVAR